MDNREEIVRHFGNKLRVRVNGVLIEHDKLLMVKHQSLGSAGFLWNVPGGGMEFGQSAEEALQREFEEETGLRIEVCDFLFVHELLMQPLHAMELFFRVKRISGSVTRGTDPEMDERQIIDEVAFLSWFKIAALSASNKHNVFNKCNNLDDLLHMNGYLIQSETIK